ncbi:MAG: isoprenylcysteine carboxylmethyltransferase family protein [Gammaproteobacteria bacterium]|nr:isoprenylcysteine carboxylmethyltransferase family protein [Gammaproteobacteria bacterium]
MLLIRGLFGALFQIVLFAALLFIPAGTWQWPRAIQFLSVYSILVLVSTVLLARIAPSSLEARLEVPFAKSQPMADRVITLFLILSILAWFVFIPIDVFHLQMSPLPHFVVSAFGAILFFSGYGILTLALFQNEFSVPVVRDQSERGQVLIDTGLYGYVRHPFYLGFLLFLVGISLWLESYASVFTLTVVLGLLVARILVEEKALREMLPGYIEYVKKVRYRLVPFIW